MTKSEHFDSLDQAALETLKLVGKRNLIHTMTGLIPVPCRRACRFDLARRAQAQTNPPITTPRQWPTKLLAMLTSTTHSNTRPATNGITVLWVFCGRSVALKKLTSQDSWGDRFVGATPLAQEGIAVL